MEMILVKSRAISHIGYDSNTKQMKITFKQGRTYDYCGVPQNIFDGFLNASSIGRYYYNYINDNYNCY
ncbi:MAG: KTSC domain-containing protein [Sulfurimonas sp.]|uniref:KTSC domain-containing protein n=1 Tax=Sulfurimonas sp. TaxID=2022749 RepID=UPI0028CD6B45|nr:KTSC domain-containing protein [Sulfurimonas sp.]MDT8339826.1 KTSC domain-containing protein [Sulfurimonas sp.]